MTRKIIVHSTFVQGDGSGDLVYLLHWLKSFSAYYPGNAQQRVLVFAIDPEKIKKFLLSFYKTEPDHPIFKFFKIESKSIVPVSAGSVKHGFIGQVPVLFGPVDFKSFFSDIADDTNVTLFKISSPINMCFKDLQKRIAVENTYGILEFDAAPEFAATADFSALGLGRKDFGLLHDIGGITGLEAVEDYLQKLTPNLKRLIFQNEDISIADAKAHLAEVPTVFIYLSGLCNAAVLDSVLRSPIIQAAIAAGKKPLFFITQNNPIISFPQSVTDACKEGKIRVVKEWLSSEEYSVASALLMNRETSSIIIPSGDNTLTSCIKAGKFPLYAHQLPMADFMKPHFKYGIFRIMLKFLESESISKAWNSKQGYSDCKQVLALLSKQIDKKSSTDVAPCITQDMLAFFRDLFAPYLMKNFAFEKKTLPRLLSLIQRDEEMLGKSKVITVKFTETKEKTEPVKVTKDVVKDDKNGSFAGFKKGFFL